MAKIIHTQIAGRELPLNCSTKAIQKIMEKYGSLENFSSSIGGENTDPGKALASTVWLLSVLLEQGAAYKKVFEGETVDTFTEDQLAALLSPADIAELQPDIMAAINGGMKREVEVKPPKNA